MPDNHDKKPDTDSPSAASRREPASDASWSENALREVRSESPPPVDIRRVSYKGWDDCIQLDNGKVTAILVPQTGRIASFARSSGSNVFWENPQLLGTLPDSQPVEWKNFGGDKSWPAPQSQWPKFKQADWPPPIAFDQMPVSVTEEKDSVTTVSAVDKEFGLQIKRNIKLEPGLPTMTVTTSFEKVSGEPVRVGVWSIAQVNEPALVAVPLAKPSMMAGGFTLQMGSGAPSQRLDDGLLSLVRDPSQEHKVGADSHSLIWIGEDSVLHMSAPRTEGEYPDGGSSVELYTSALFPYVELELLGPMQTIACNEKSIPLTVTYELFDRNELAQKAKVSSGTAELRDIAREAIKYCGSLPKISGNRASGKSSAVVSEGDLESSNFDDTTRRVEFADLKGLAQAGIRGGSGSTEALPGAFATGAVGRSSASFAVSRKEVPATCGSDPRLEPALCSELPRPEQQSSEFRKPSGLGFASSAAIVGAALLAGTKSKTRPRYIFPVQVPGW